MEHIVSPFIDLSFLYSKQSSSCVVVVQGGSNVEILMGVVVEGVIVVGVMFIGSGPNGGLKGGKQ